MHDLPQFLVFETGSASSDRLNELHVRVEEAFAQNALTDHASRAEDEHVHAFTRCPQCSAGLCLVIDEARIVVWAEVSMLAEMNANGMSRRMCWWIASLAIAWCSNPRCVATWYGHSSFAGSQTPPQISPRWERLARAQRTPCRGEQNCMAFAVTSGACHRDLSLGEYMLT
jgi:hypothetical protein